MVLQRDSNEPIFYSHGYQLNLSEGLSYFAHPPKSSLAYIITHRYLYCVLFACCNFRKSTSFKVIIRWKTIGLKSVMKLSLRFV